MCKTVVGQNFIEKNVGTGWFSIKASNPHPSPAPAPPHLPLSRLVLEVAVRHGGNESAQKHHHDDRVRQNHDLDILPKERPQQQKWRDKQETKAPERNKSSHLLGKEFFGPGRCYSRCTDPIHSHYVWFSFWAGARSQSGGFVIRRLR